MTDVPKRAVVLAAGFGSRLEPLTRLRPKPLFPVWGRTMLDHVLDRLASWGVRDVLINLHHHPDPILAHVRRRKPDRLRVSLVYEPEILGTGGALVNAAWFVAGGPCWLVNADVLMEVEPRPLVRAFRDPGVIASAWVTPEAGPRTVDVSRGVITSFRSRTAGASGTATFCGLQIISPDLLRYLPARGFSTVIDGYERAMKAGRTVRAVEIKESIWHDIGTLDQYLDAHRRFRYRKRDRRFARAWSPGFTAPENHVSCRDTVMWEGASADAGTFDQAVIATRVPPGLHGAGMFMAAADVLNRDERALLQAAGMTVDASTGLQAFARRGSERQYVRVRRGARSVMLLRVSTRRVTQYLGSMYPAPPGPSTYMAIVWVSSSASPLDFSINR